MFKKSGKTQHSHKISGAHVAALLLIVCGPLSLISAEEKTDQAPAFDPVELQAAGETNLTVLSILPFTTEEEDSTMLGEKIAEEIQVPLTESGRFKVLTRSELTLEDMNRLVEIQAKQGKAEQRAPFQSFSCEQAFVTGSVRKYGETGYRVYLRVISLSTGELLIALQMRCWHENALSRIAKAFARELLSRVNINGTVVQTAGDAFYVTMDGGVEGVKKGDKLAVRKPVSIEKTGGEAIHPGKNKPFTTLEVQEITASDHLRCTIASQVKKDAARPAAGDLVHLIPICPECEHTGRRQVVAVLPFETSKPAGKTAPAVPESFPFVVQQELLFGGGTLHGMKIVNPEGLDRFAAAGDKPVDARVICDALNVDGVLTGRFVVMGDEIRVYEKLVLYPQVELYSQKNAVRTESVTKRVVVPLGKDGSVSVETAIAITEETIKAFTPESLDAEVNRTK